MPEFKIAGVSTDSSAKSNSQGSNFSFNNYNNHYNNMIDKASNYGYDQTWDSKLDKFLGWQTGENPLKKLIETPVNLLYVPTRTALSGINSLVTHQNVIKGMVNGFTGKTNVVPTDILKNAGVSTDSWNPFVKFAVNMAGMGAVDPLGWMSKHGSVMFNKESVKGAESVEPSALRPEDKFDNSANNPNYSKSKTEMKTDTKNILDTLPLSEEIKSKFTDFFESSKQAINLKIKFGTDNLRKNQDEMYARFKTAQDEESKTSLGAEQPFSPKSLKDTASAINPTFSSLPKTSKEVIREAITGDVLMKERVNVISNSTYILRDKLVSSLNKEYEQTGNIKGMDFQKGELDNMTTEDRKEIITNTFNNALTRKLAFDDGVYNKNLRDVIFEMTSGAVLSGYRVVDILKGADLNSVLKKSNRKDPEDFLAVYKNTWLKNRDPIYKTIQDDIVNIMNSGVENDLDYLKIGWKPVWNADKTKITSMSLELLNKTRKTLEKFDKRAQEVFALTKDMDNAKDIKNKSVNTLAAGYKSGKSIEDIQDPSLVENMKTLHKFAHEQVETMIKRNETELSEEDLANSLKNIDEHTKGFLNEVRTSLQAITKTSISLEEITNTITSNASGIIINAEKAFALDNLNTYEADRALKNYDIYRQVLRYKNSFERINTSKYSQITKSLTGESLDKAVNRETNRYLKGVIKEKNLQAKEHYLTNKVPLLKNLSKKASVNYKYLNKQSLADAESNSAKVIIEGMESKKVEIQKSIVKSETKLHNLENEVKGNLKTITSNAKAKFNYLSSKEELAKAITSRKKELLSKEKPTETKPDKIDKTVNSVQQIYQKAVIKNYSAHLNSLFSSYNDIIKFLNNKDSFFPSEINGTNKNNIVAGSVKNLKKILIDDSYLDKKMSDWNYTVPSIMGGTFKPYLDKVDIARYDDTLGAPERSYQETKEVLLDSLKNSYINILTEPLLQSSLEEINNSKIPKKDQRFDEEGYLKVKNNASLFQSASETFKIFKAINQDKIINTFESLGKDTDLSTLPTSLSARNWFKTDEIVEKSIKQAPKMDNYKDKVKEIATNQVKTEQLKNQEDYENWKHDYDQSKVDLKAHKLTLEEHNKELKQINSRYSKYKNKEVSVRKTSQKATAEKNNYIRKQNKELYTNYLAKIKSNNKQPLAEKEVDKLKKSYKKELKKTAKERMKNHRENKVKELEEQFINSLPADMKKDSLFGDFDFQSDILKGSNPMDYQNSLAYRLENNLNDNYPTFKNDNMENYAVSLKYHLANLRNSLSTVDNETWNAYNKLMKDLNLSQESLLATLRKMNVKADGIRNIHVFYNWQKTTKALEDLRPYFEKTYDLPYHNLDLLENNPQIREITLLIYGIHKIGLSFVKDLNLRNETFDLNAMSNPTYLRKMVNWPALVHNNLTYQIKHGLLKKGTIGKGGRAQIQSSWANYSASDVNATTDAFIFNVDSIGAQASWVGISKSSLVTPKITEIGLDNGMIRYSTQEEDNDIYENRVMPNGWEILVPEDLQTIIGGIVNKHIGMEEDDEIAKDNLEKEIKAKAKKGTSSGSTILVRKDYIRDLRDYQKRANIKDTDAKALDNFFQHSMKLYRGVSLMSVGFHVKNTFGNIMQHYLATGKVGKVIENFGKNFGKFNEIKKALTSQSVEDIVQAMSNQQKEGGDLQEELNNTLMRNLKPETAKFYKEEYLRLQKGNVINQHYFRESLMDDQKEVLKQLEENPSLKDKVTEKFGNPANWVNEFAKWNLSLTMLMDNAIRFETYKHFEQQASDSFKNNDDSFYDQDYQQDYEKAKSGTDQDREDFTNHYSSSKTKQTHFDYSDTSTFMKRFKSVFPFFIWSFKNVEARIKDLSKIYKGIGQAFHGDFNQEAFDLAKRYNLLGNILGQSVNNSLVSNAMMLNPYISTGSSIPIQIGNKVYYFKFGSPISAFADFFSANTLSSVNPYWKTAYESVTGRDIETGRQITNFNSTMTSNFLKPFTGRVGAISQVYNSFGKQYSWGQELANLGHNPFVGVNSQGYDATGMETMNKKIALALRDNFLKGKGLSVKKTKNDWNFKYTPRRFRSK